MKTQTQLDMLAKVKDDAGFIAALDQSGGSTPTALKLYGVDEYVYSNDEEMFSCVHQMRTRIMTSPAFTGERVLGAILFENTLDRDVEGLFSAHYLWMQKKIVPFLKVDKGLEDETNGVQLMKPISGLTELLEKASKHGVFGTKMRSVVKLANEVGVNEIVAQQFTVAKQIIAAGLVPIIEPEIDINSPEKAQAEVLLKAAILNELDALSDDQYVMLKLTLPESANFYKECIEHPKVIKVVALSGGYSRDVANQKLSENKDMVASFSRALTEGVSFQQSDNEFHSTLNSSIEHIYQASIT